MRGADLGMRGGLGEQVGAGCRERKQGTTEDRWRGREGPSSECHLVLFPFLPPSFAAFSKLFNTLCFPAAVN